MRAVVLVDNIGNALAKGEWGLSIYIEYRDKKILLDTGASGLFLENARQYALPVGEVDYAVLSHAHYDHSRGMRDFFRVNHKAFFYVRRNTGKKLYALVGGFHIFRKSSKEVSSLAERLSAFDIEKIYTGHCTGQKSYEILKSVLGDKAEQLKVGLEIKV